MGELATFAGFLQAYGGWGVACALGLVFVKYYQDQKKIIEGKDAALQKANEEHNQEIIAVLRECAGALGTVEEVMNRCERRQERLKNE
jgi:uncharacterized protein HemX